MKSSSKIRRQNLFGLRSKPTQDYYVEGVGSFPTKAAARTAARKEAAEVGHAVEIRWKQGLTTHSEREVPRSKTRALKAETVAGSRITKAETVAGSYGGYRIMKTPEGEFYSSFDPESRFSTKKQAEELINWFKRGNPVSKKKKKSAANPSKFDRCVRDVKRKGGVVDPYAVCTAAGTRNPQQRSMAYEAGRHALSAAAARLGTVNLTPSIAQKEEWGHAWKEFMAGWNAEKKRDNPRLNPADAAVQGFEAFHGHQPDEIVEVVKKVHFHEHLSGAGILKRLVVLGIDGKKHSIQAFGGALLAFNEQRNQLFIEGGDQRMNLEDFGISEPHEVETLGEVKVIDYHTTKDHLGSEGGTATYTHKFRTTNENGEHVTVKVARYPDLIYRVRDEQLEFSGGSYKIRAEGIDK